MSFTLISEINKNESTCVSTLRSIWILISPLIERNLDHSQTSRQRPIVVESITLPPPFFLVRLRKAAPYNMVTTTKMKTLRTKYVKPYDLITKTFPITQQPEHQNL